MSHVQSGVARQIRVIGWWGAALLVIALAFALRIHALGQPNLTGDEWFMLRNHDEGPAWIIHQAHTFEPHPLLYYLGLAAWIEVVGRSEFSMRFPSVLFGVLLTPALIGLGRALIDRWAGIFAGALVAVNPYQIAESQNARNYAMVVSLSAIATLLFLRALDRRRQRDWLAYGLAMWLALNSHYDAALVLAAHVVYVVGRWCHWARRQDNQKEWRQ
ncbi:MAG TPA: glycosyltransferase family 39 protein, partial [Chloroflexota bacterium]|nr:glycosyltransferase family 39 protein [Chloroflexota bacterium]